MFHDILVQITRSALAFFVTMGRAIKKVSYFPRKKVDREYFPLPKGDESLCRKTLFAVRLKVCIGALP